MSNVANDDVESLVFADESERDGDGEIEPFDHDAKLQTLLDAYDRALRAQLDSPAAQWIVEDGARKLMRQAIEQVWDVAHACAKVNGR